MKLSKVSKEYKMKDSTVKALDNIDFEIDEKKGGFHVIMGHSGSGKSTLIQILGLLDKPTSGKYTMDNKNVEELTEEEKAKIRMQKIGFIFQSFHLDPYLKAYENVMLPMFINEKIEKEEIKNKAIGLLNTVNLNNRIEHFPKELSGGEQQRVAIARALANDPDIILADEPTGNLDVENEEYIFELLKKISKQGKCVIVVSHNEVIKKYADYVYTMKDGKIKELK